MTRVRQPAWHATRRRDCLPALHAGCLPRWPPARWPRSRRGPRRHFRARPSELIVPYAAGLACRTPSRASSGGGCRSGRSVGRGGEPAGRQRQRRGRCDRRAAGGRIHAAGDRQRHAFGQSAVLQTIAYSLQKDSRRSRCWRARRCFSPCIRTCRCRRCASSSTT